jgi:L-alanine-DL-glutamate epimerase-like enolase superfamily enzyme
MSIDKLEVKYFDIPTEIPERDGTLEWQSTGLVNLELYSGSHKGLGYTYADRATASFLVEHAIPFLKGKDENHHFLLINELKKKNRNLGNAGLTSMALSAVDIALWDLKARVLNISIQNLLGLRRESTPFYGSGFFLNNDSKGLMRQLNKFQEMGMKAYKMKIGDGIESDISRMKEMRNRIGEEASLFVDTNGYYGHKEALELSREMEKLNVSWFEEPISSDDLNGLQLLKERLPFKVNLVAGEYCYQISDVLRLIENKAVDIMQVDATRCEGVTGAIRASQLAHAYNLPVSTHCAPLLHGNIGLSLENLYISEHFYDHTRIEEKYFTHEESYTDGAYIPSTDQIGFRWDLNSQTREYLIYEHTTLS